MKQKFTFDDHLDHLKAFKSFIGKTVLEISHCKYFYNDEPDSEADGDLEVKFDDGSVLTLTILGDGESMVAKDEAMNIPESFIIDDINTCSWRRILLNDEPIWKDIIGAKLTDIESIIDHWKDLNQKILGGCRLSFSNGHFILFCNAGDNAHFMINDLSLVDKLDGVETKLTSIT